MHLLFSVVIIGQLPHSETKTWGVAHRIIYGDNVHIYIYNIFIFQAVIQIQYKYKYNKIQIKYKQYKIIK